MNTTCSDLSAAQALADLPALGSPPPDLQAIVVIPARDEAPRIASCLRALATQRDMAGDGYELIVVLDGCADGTLQVIERVARLLEKPAIHTVNLVRPAGVGRARRLGMDIAGRWLLQIGKTRGLIASTDADTTVAADWLSAQLDLAESGVAAIGGLIELDATEQGTARPPCAHGARAERGATTHQPDGGDRG